MGYHDMPYYNTKCFKGNTDKTGFAWWYNQALENPDRPSHYPSFIPLELMREVLGWTAEESIELLAKFVIDGTEYLVPVTDHKAIGRGDWIVNGIPDNEEADANKILSVVTTEYGVHQAKEIFVKNVSELVDGESNIGVESFGELKWGRRLFASFSLPDHLLNMDSGMEFRPILTVVTSYDRTLATKYVRTYGIPICDNTLNMELVRADKESGGQFVLKHSKNSAGRLVEAKKVLGLLTSDAEAMDAYLSELMRIEVPEDIFVKWLETMVPIPEVKRTTVTVKSIQGEDVQVEKISANAQSIALKKREKLVEMWDTDDRVRGPEGQWKNTGLGILQLWNTFNQREAGTKSLRESSGEEYAKRLATRVQSDMEKTIDGKFMVEDKKALKVLDVIREEHAPVTVAAAAPKRRTTAKANV